MENETALPHKSNTNDSEESADPLQIVLHPTEGQINLQAAPNQITDGKKGAFNEKIAALPLYDLSGLKSISGSDEGFVKKMVFMFLESVPKMMDIIETALQQENWRQIAQETHKLKPQVLSMGIVSITQELENMEMFSKKNAYLNAIPAIFQKVENVLDAVLAQLKTDFAKFEA